MIKSPNRRFTALINLLFPLFCLVQGCKKSSGGDASTSYYFTATVNGKAWAANTSNNSYHSPALGGLTTANGVGVAAVVAVQAINNDSSAFVVVFPQNITLNTQYAVNPAQYTEGAYVSEVSPGSASYNQYNTTSTTGGSGSLTITLFDQTAKVMEGTFSGVFGSLTGGAAVTVTNGKFRCPYTTDASQLPATGGISIKM
jgi:hypothetical protein